MVKREIRYKSSYFPYLPGSDTAQDLLKILMEEREKIETRKASLVALIDQLDKEIQECQTETKE